MATNHDDLMNEQRDQTEEKQGRQMAASQAADPNAGVQFEGQRRLLEELGLADIADEDDPDDDLDDQLQTELSRWHMLGNLTENEYEELVPLMQNKAERVKVEHPRPSRAGSKCRGEVRKIMLGDQAGDVAELTPAMSRRYDEAMEVRRKMVSASIDGMLLDAITKIHAVAETITSGTEDGGESRIAAMGEMLPGVGN